MGSILFFWAVSDGEESADETVSAERLNGRLDHLSNQSGVIQVNMLRSYRIKSLLYKYESSGMRWKEVTFVRRA